jgi:hypothetical protein
MKRVAEPMAADLENTERFGQGTGEMLRASRNQQTNEKEESK